jgi:anti-sigma regulatory factor (Ser/Thr protein kinase)
VRVETTRTAAPVRLQHACAVYSSSADLVEQVAPVVADAAGRGEAVALSVRPETEARLRDAAGTARVVTLGTGIPARSSGQTTAARLARELRELTSQAGAVLAVSEHDSALDGIDGRYWTELDAAVNVALSDLPVSLFCFYPDMPLHSEILDGAIANHPLLFERGRLHVNADHRPPRDVLAGMPAAPPVLLGAPDLDMVFSAWQLHEVRAAVADLAAATAFDTARSEDVVLAVNEIATNAVEHGSGEARIALWIAGDGLVAEIDDTGEALTEPLPGLRAPHPADPRGRGVWIARQLCDVLHVWRDHSGTHVRMHAAP